MAPKSTAQRLAEIDQQDIVAVRALDKRRQEIIEGDLPRLEEILIYATWCKDSIVTDRNHFFTSIRADLKLNRRDAGIIDQAVVDGSTSVLMLARGILEKRNRFSDVARCDLYIACGGDFDAAGDARKRLFHARQVSIFDGRFGSALRDATLRGMLHNGGIRGSSDLVGWQESGLHWLLSRGRMADLYVKVKDVISDPEELFVFEFDIGDVEEDRAEFEKTEVVGPTAVVVPKMDAGSGGLRETRKAYKQIAGKELPLKQRGPVDLHYMMLAGRWPHAAGVIETILSDLAADERVYFRPTLLVGESGTGKSALARAIAEQLSLPCELYSLSGASDSSLMGTSAQWSTSRPSVPLQLVQRSGYANALIVWDEIEKADQGRNNGSALDALLPMLERSQAKAVRDLALEVEVDLSWVSHFATANSVSDIPAPLRDRMRIIEMPQPEWKHIGPLSRNIIRDIAKERGIHEKWFPPLEGDELEVIQKHWNGGSLRRLKAAIMATLDVRDKMMERV